MGEYIQVRVCCHNDNRLVRVQTKFMKEFAVCGKYIHVEYRVRARGSGSYIITKYIKFETFMNRYAEKRRE